LNEDYQHETFRLEREHWWYRARQKIILSQFRRRYKDGNDLRILDIGCGAGTLLSGLSRFGRVVGLDPCPDAVEAVRRRSYEARLGAVPHDVPGDMGRFDAVCLFDVVEHIDDDTSALRCAHSLLGPGGVVFVTVPALPWLYGIHDEINEHRRRYTHSGLTEVLIAAGFVRTWTSYFNMLLSPLLIPAILWRSRRRSGHNFEVQSRFSPLLERVFSLERFLLGRLRLPFGLSLFATAERA
jgi:2-polyprenyl-3-methyl-5-hydroxy-6-metoxy-1,4-benzoquinol methylase